MLVLLNVVSPVILFFEDWIGLDGFELSLEVPNGVAMGAAIGAATSIVEVVAQVLLLITRHTPVDSNHQHW